jgi:hypothetical protein
MSGNSNAYMAGRKQYARPQAILFSKNAGYLQDGKYIPDGYEFGASGKTDAESSFLILSDHNRSPIDFKTTRIENRKRMINGRMRSYHIADKLNINLSWNMIPSRGYSASPQFNTSTGATTGTGTEFTVDGGAGGVELLKWYENNTGPFWVFLSYDKYNNFDTTANKYAHLFEYNEVIEVYISSFDYSVQKRGAHNMDLWNISMSLEEV